MDKSHVEIKGFEAKFYDFILIAATFGYYQKLIKKAIEDMKINIDDKILDLGAGTGKNALLIKKYLSYNGSITALEIGKEMRRQFVKNCSNHKNIKLLNMRIENDLPFNNEFDKVFISFVIHGLSQDKRERVIQNAYKVLKQGGKFFIFDWNEFDLNKTGLFLKSFFRFIECPLAHDFIKRDLKKLFKDFEFRNIQEKLYTKGKIRLLVGEK